MGLEVCCALLRPLFNSLNVSPGIIPWIDPTPNNIKQAASRLALALPKMTKFLFNPSAQSTRQISTALDTASWKIGSETLWLSTNLSNDTVTMSGVSLHEWAKGDSRKPYSYQWLLSENAVVTSNGVLELGPLGSVIFVISELQSVSQSQPINRDEL